MKRNVITRLLQLSVYGLACGVLALATEARAQTSSEKIVIDASKQHRDALTTLTPLVDRQFQKVRPETQKMLEEYDDIMALGPCSRRDALVQLYEAERPRVIARRVNLDATVLRLVPAYEAAMEFMETYVDYSYLPCWEEMGNLTFMAETSIGAARAVPRLPALPDSLPDEPRPNVIMVSQTAPRKVKVGKVNELAVTVRCTRRYSEGKATVEVGIGSGPGKFLDPTEQRVQLGPNETRTLVFRYTATAEGTVRVGARVVP